MSAHIEVDLDLCQGHAMCELEAPQHFRVPHRGTAEILTAHAEDTDLPAVERAEWACPNRALTVRRAGADHSASTA
ncbi:ferredoxin [Mycobacterium intracellulare]|uniref:ferredoxin n=1 Tax=Mycobacterium intracellulare TaxID=1767 RepID=UPI0001B4519C|nr:ferredoxin [Mycobacterium intracellulare]AFC47450.1 ferredoxin [Mycobacterium intracellulare MOTT-02]ASW94268.1 ferredoxin [Mycobacterium intracellulare]MCA2235510.1 ferredoxin [Mycobacterium intracellulare]MCA2256636.1 ferredoxin [Mycobacterium intracellulare]MCA2356825.1 ferredoxin [Mycobacterium intracellulare]